MKVEDRSMDVMKKFSELEPGDAFRDSEKDSRRLFMKIADSAEREGRYIDLRSGMLYLPVGDPVVIPVDAKVVIE